MYNLDVALAGFWQIARHWKNGDKAKIKLSCEAGNLHMQLSAILGHPDQRHFPHPPPPPPNSSCKRKSPSQLCRQDCRRKEAVSRVEETVNDLVKETEPKPSEKTLKLKQMSLKSCHFLKRTMQFIKILILIMIFNPSNVQECFKALGSSKTCEVCNDTFETQKECYEHMCLSKRQICSQFQS